MKTCKNCGQKMAKSAKRCPTDAMSVGAGIVVSPDISNPYSPPNWVLPNSIPIPIPASGTNFSTEIAFRPFANNASGAGNSYDTLAGAELVV